MLSKKWGKHPGEKDSFSVFFSNDNAVRHNGLLSVTATNHSKLLGVILYIVQIFLFFFVYFFPLIPSHHKAKKLRYHMVSRTAFWCQNKVFNGMHKLFFCQIAM